MEIVTIATTFVFLLLSAFFSASETALFSISKEQFPTLEKGDAKDKAIYALLSRGEDTLIVILLCNIFVNLSIISGVYTLLFLLFGERLEAELLLLGVAGPTVILVLFGEIIPKSIAVGKGRAIARFSAPKLLFLSRMLLPVASLFKGLNKRLLRINYHYLLRSPAPYITSAEYESALALSVKRGEVPVESADFLSDFLSLTNVPIQAVAVHRSQVAEYDDVRVIGPDVLLAVVCGEDSQHAVWYQGRVVTASWIPLSRTVGDLLELMKESGNEVVLVADEYGAYYGVVTLPVLLDYLGEFMEVEEGLSTESILEVQGDSPLIEYRELIPQEMLDAYPEVKTINGLITSWFGSIPEQGEILETKSCIFHIVEADERRIETLRIEKRRP